KIVPDTASWNSINAATLVITYSRYRGAVAIPCKVRLRLLDKPRAFLIIGKGSRRNVERVPVAPGNDDEIPSVRYLQHGGPRHASSFIPYDQDQAVVGQFQLARVTVEAQ